MWAIQSVRVNSEGWSRVAMGAGCSWAAVSVELQEAAFLGSRARLARLLSGIRAEEIDSLFSHGKREFPSHPE